MMPNHKACIGLTYPDLLSSTNQIQLQRCRNTSVNGAAAFWLSINIPTDHHQKNHLQKPTWLRTFNTKGKSYASTGLRIVTILHFETRLSSMPVWIYVDRATSDLKSFYFSGGYFGQKSMLKAIIFSGMKRLINPMVWCAGSKIKNDTRE